MSKAIIIGSGIGGLAASVRLALKGYDTTVFEASGVPGGKLHEFNLGAYRFDGGPSLLTMPEEIDALFVLAGKDPQEHFRYHPLSTSCHYFYADGTRFEAPGAPDQFAKSASVTFGVPEEHISRYLNECRSGLDGAGKIFLQNSLHRKETWLSAKVLKMLPRLPQLGLFGSLHKSNKKALKDARLVQLFDRFATYNGSDPYRTPGMMKVIAALEHGEGSYYPEGGMYQIAQSVYQLALELGVRFRFNEKVERIRTVSGRAVGVTSNQAEFDADLVLSNMDVVPTYRNLLPEHPAPERSLRQERSSSAFIFYWGIRKSFEQLGVHNIFFSKNYREEFQHLFHSDRPFQDPTIYVNIGSKYAPNDAPQGCENWFVMVNAPHHKNQNWEEIGKLLKQDVLERLSKELGIDISSLIEEEAMWSPQGIEAQTSSHLGALYGSSSNNMLAAFLRHPNFSSSIKNLYFCGGSVHPGGGIPLALLSARITCDLIPEANVVR